MTKLLALGLTVFCTALSTHARAAAEDDVTMHVERVATPAAALERIESGALAQRPLGPVLEEGDGIDIGTIINIGKEVWQIIADNQPVVDISYDYATALPRGVQTAAELDGFSDLQYESWRMYGTNGFGMTVYDVTYTLVHQYGGSYGGKGRYLATVSVLPSNVSVLWGYTVNFGVKNVSTVNVGTAEAPVGSLSLELSFSVSTIIKSHTSTTLFQFRGDSAEVRSTDI